MKVDLNQLDHMDDTVVSIANAIEKEFGVEFKASSLLRPGDKGVHGFGRGIDLSCPNKQLGYVVEHWVNTKYEYDHARPAKKCCLYHKTPRGAWHLHLQSHPNTRLR